MQPQIKHATVPLDWRKADQEDYLKDPFMLEQAAGGSSSYRERYRQPLVAVIITVALVLLIACANIANLMLARANARRHEMGLRIALGASRLRIARQMLTESLLLSGLARRSGLLLATWGSAFLVRELTTFRDNVTLDSDARLADPRLHGRRGRGDGAAVRHRARLPRGQVEPNEALKDRAARCSATGTRLGQPLVVVQVALSLVLVVAAGLFLRTFASLTQQRLGYDTERRCSSGWTRRRAAWNRAGRRSTNRCVRRPAGARCVVRGAVCHPADERHGLEQHDRGAGRAGAAAEGSDRLVQRRVARVVRDLRREVRGGP